MTATTREGAATIERLQAALLANALADELHGFEEADQAEAAQFISEIAAVRLPGELAIKLESTGGEAGRRRMRLAIVNDDMPFLVDSVANAIAANYVQGHESHFNQRDFWRFW